MLSGIGVFLRLLSAAAETAFRLLKREHDSFLYASKTAENSSNDENELFLTNCSAIFDPGKG